MRLGDHRQYARLTVRRDENNGESTKKQNLFRYEYDWLFRRSWYLGATASYRFDYESKPAPGKSRDHSTLAFGLGARF